ncbi:AraC family transcriptional regulator [Cohnella sp. REN36]|uniref:AraC family transcriptional regulator n=1 Tax=Cohnella sp. REN36 TaxID=2887347 RepID=UPI001D13AC00|nr:AraC family transcriptional regulator [Cohnella sp. REN36]MCC3373334.1 AraC family transcriptional regulator [Cohnella sp. REN36]
MSSLLRFALTPGQERRLPLFVETIGTMPDEGRMARPEGYPYYHWLQTIEGEGLFTAAGKSYALPVGSGLLLSPHVPHAYAPVGGRWHTAYLTFGGPAVPEMVRALDLQESCAVQWEADSPLAGFVYGMLERMASDSDLFGLNGSADAYRFLLTLRQYGRFDNQASIVHASEKLRPLIAWMDRHYADPEIGLSEMLAVLGMPSSTTNELFQRTFAQSPYSYLVHFRIRKAKELLIAAPEETVKSIAAKVGFRDVSHFVATFRRKTGLPPEKFRQLYK